MRVVRPPSALIVTLTRGLFRSADSSVSNTGAAAQTVNEPARKKNSAANVLRANCLKAIIRIMPSSVVSRPVPVYRPVARFILCLLAFVALVAASGVASAAGHFDIKLKDGTTVTMETHPGPESRWYCGCRRVLAGSPAKLR